MTRSVSFSESEAEALREARFRCRVDTASDLLRAALRGDEAALGALRDTWPGPSEAGVAWEEIHRLTHEHREAARRLDASAAVELRERIDVLKADHPRPEPRTKARRVGLADSVVDRLLELAKTIPRYGPGRPSAAEGIKALLNGGGKDADHG